jgi:hypothetical protein
MWKVRYIVDKFEYYFWHIMVFLAGVCVGDFIWRLIDDAMQKV